MGGLRVTEISTGLAIVHGISAQLFLALLLVIGLMTSGAWRRIQPAVLQATGKQRAFSVAALALLFLQITLGALTRHLPGSNHPLLTHIGFSIIAAAAIVLAGAHAAKIAREPIMKKLGTAHLHAVGLQMVLGVGALAVVILHGDAEQPTPVDLLVTTTHQVVGAILLAVVTLAAVWSYRAIKPEPRPAAALA
jgi:heme A synthase